MNEIHRLAYLDALGIDSYVSRTQLSGAAPSHRARLLRVEDAAQPSVVAPSVAPIVLEAPGADPVFSVLNCRVGGWCWLDEIPRGREPGREYLLLLQAIANSLGWQKSEMQLERFDWPIGDTRQMGNADTAARDGFQGYLRGRLDRQPAAGIVLLGVADASWLSRESFSEFELVKTVSAWQMLRQPQLKRQAWLDFKAQVKP